MAGCYFYNQHQFYREHSRGHGGGTARAAGPGKPSAPNRENLLQGGTSHSSMGTFLFLVKHQGPSICPPGFRQ